MSPTEPDSLQDRDGLASHASRSGSWSRSDLGAWLAGREGLSDAEAVDEACSHLIAHWERRRHVPVEAYLGLHPALAPDTEGAYELIYTEFTLRRERGEDPGVEEYAHRFPGFATRLRRQAALDEAIDRATADTLGRGPIGLGPRDDDPGFEDPAPGQADWPSLDRFEIVEELGRGSMGVVYKAREIGLGRLVALKMMLAGQSSSGEALPRFLAEARTIARLVHPNIVQIHSIGEHEGRPFLELEYLSGGSLASRLDGKPWPPERAAELVSAVAKGIEQAHSLGVIHRDLKPANILLARDDTPRVADFGVAKLLDREAHFTQTHTLVGSPSYMAPEQADWDVQTVGPTADVYALGAVLYELLTGRPPFRGTNVLNTLEQVRTAEPVPPGRLVKGLPRDLETIALKCLEKSPSRRYPTAQSLCDDLGRFLRREPIQARPAHALERARRWCSRHPAIAGLVLALATAIGLGVSGIAWNWRVAVNERWKAERSRTDAVLARNDSQRLLAGLDLERALTRANEGEVGEALIWMAEGLRQAPPDDPNFDLAVRRNLTAWSGLSDSLQQVFTFPTPVTALDFTPDARRLVVGLQGNEVRFVDPLTREPRGPTFKTAAPVDCVAVHPSGKTFVAGGELAIGIRDIDTGKPVGKPMPHPEVPFRLAFSADGRLLISTCRTASAFVWDSATGEPIGRLDLPDPNDHCFGVAFSPDGRTALTASLGSSPETGGSVHLWDLSGGVPAQPRARLAHPNAVVAAHFSPGGDVIASGSVDRSVRFWEVATGRQIAQSNPLPSVVEPVRFRPDGAAVFTGCGDGVGRWWDASTGLGLGSPVQHDSAIWAVAFSPDSRLMATGSRDRTLRVWRTASRESLRPVDSASPDPLAPPPSAQLDAAAYSPDRTRLATGDSRGNLRILDLDRGRVLVDRKAHDLPVGVLIYSADGSRIATLGNPWEVRKELRTWTADGEPLATVRHDATLIGLDLSPDGRLCVGAGFDDRIFVWETDTGREITPSWRSTGQAWGLDLSPDGRQLATADSTGLVLWEIPSGRKLLHLKAETDRLSYHPDGKSLLMAEGRVARLVDSSTGERLGSPVSLDLTGTGFGFFLAKGSASAPGPGTLLSWGGEGFIRRWSDLTGEPIGNRIRALSPISAIDVAPRAAFLLSGGIDGTVQLWDLPTGQPIGRHFSLGGPVLAVAFGLDGLTFSAVGRNGIARRWPVPEPMPGDVADLTRRFVKRTVRRLDSGRTVVPLRSDEWLGLHAPDGPPVVARPAR